MTNNDLTARQQLVLDAITAFIAEHRFPPTVRELGTILDISSPNGVICHLNALQAKGRLSRDKRHSRTIRIISEWHENGDNVLRLLKHLTDTQRLDTLAEVLDFLAVPERFQAEWDAMEAESCPSTPTT